VSEEGYMNAETDPSPAIEPAEAPKSSRVPRWVVISAAFILAVVVSVIVYGYVARPGWIGVAGKKFWDYLELLIVPAALALGVAWLSWMQRQREREAEDAQQAHELAVENQRAQDAALQAYLDQMSQLMLDKDRPLRQSEARDEVRTLARARTLTVLPRLNGERKWSVLQFLYESDLVTKGRVVLDLRGADLRGMYLSKPDLGVTVDYPGFRPWRRIRWGEPWQSHIMSSLRQLDLAAAHSRLSKADLSFVNLSGARLSQALLDEAILRDADLRRADLSIADLQGANLEGANLEAANLQGADLSRANLSDTNLAEVELDDANLEGANLNRARGIPEIWLLAEKVDSLQGATMPNG
jgi:uncharacterized protein YjbI with pentapeptide repeats